MRTGAPPSGRDVSDYDTGTREIRTIFGDYKIKGQAWNY